MNYITQLTAVSRLFYKDKRLKPNHISLYHAIFQMANAQGFTEDLYLARTELMELSKIKSTVTYYKCLKQLKAWNYITYIASSSPLESSLINIIELNNAVSECNHLPNQNLIHKGLKNDSHSGEPNQNLIHKGLKNDSLSGEPNQNLIHKGLKNDSLSVEHNQNLIHKGLKNEPNQKMIYKGLKNDSVESETNKNLIVNELNDELVEKESNQKLIHKESKNDSVNEPNQNLIHKGLKNDSVVIPYSNNIYNIYNIYINNNNIYNRVKNEILLNIQNFFKENFKKKYEDVFSETELELEAENFFLYFESKDWKRAKDIPINDFRPVATMWMLNAKKFKAQNKRNFERKNDLGVVHTKREKNYSEPL